MDRLSTVMVRTSLVWLLAGFAIGGAMLTDRELPGDWRLWMGPSHAHMLFVGWFLQFALGIAYWLLPRKRSATRPLGYYPRAAMLAVAALNLGLLLRIAAEPAERTGHEATWIFAALSCSAVLQMVAALTFVVQLWPRVATRSARTNPSDQKAGVR